MKTDNPINRTWRKMQAIGGVLVLVTAAVLLQVCSAVQYYFSRDGIRNEVRQRAVSEMKVKNLEILQMVTRVETSVANMQWELEKSMAHPDSVYPVLRRIMATSPDLVGCAIAFQPEYFPDKGHWYEPYMFRGGDSLVDKQIGSATHNYFEMPWYTDGLASDHGLWTEPYIDSSGSEGIVCTYTIPLCDTSGRKVALFGADVTLDWLSDLFEQKEAVITYLFSHAGRMIVCPDSSMAMRFTLDEASSAYNDTTSKRINRNILEGRQGDAEVEYQGEKYQLFYSPVGGSTGWSMCLVFPEKEIYRGLHHVSRMLMFTMLIGLLFLGFIMWRTLRGMRKLSEVSAEKERIGSELKIARNIQMGMLPKTFPPYPDCDEVTIYGSLVPAKEVGGDLYDFNVNNGRLLFCVGDVSGKGVPASLMMAVTRSLFRTVSYQTDKPDEIMRRMNDAMSEMNENSLFVTFFIGSLDFKTGDFSYSNAGHCPPILIGPKTTVLEMDANIPLGIMSGWDYTGRRPMWILTPSYSIIPTASPRRKTSTTDSMEKSACSPNWKRWAPPRHEPSSTTCRRLYITLKPAPSRATTSPCSPSNSTNTNSHAIHSHTTQQRTGGEPAGTFHRNHRHGKRPGPFTDDGTQSRS
ncbi:MAG: SpoIIE family protein phosphatase [Bacteroidales bacterium]|nr:SpoIIE family protein phosphatase [Bacteroidales bacterium]